MENKNYIYLKSIFVCSVIITFIVTFSVLLNYFFYEDVFQINRFKVYIVWSFVLILMSIIYRKSYFLVYIFVFFGIIEFSHLVVIGAPISEASLFVLFETNIEEAKGYIDSNLNNFLLVNIVYLALSIYFFRKKFFLKNYPNYIRVFSGFILGITLIFLSGRVVSGEYYRSLPPIIASSIAYYNETKLYRKQIKLNKKKLDSVPHIKTVAPENHIILIGESVNRNHMSLYGYDKKTTPKLDELRRELIVFDNVISTHSQTLPSIKTIMTGEKYSSKGEFYKLSTLIDNLREKGYYTKWISNQAVVGLWDNYLSILSMTANSRKFVNLTGSSDRATSSISYDEKLLPYIKESIDNNLNKKQVIFVHLMGSHITYKNRYPDNHNVFKTAGDERERIIEEYDNSIHYTDSIIAKVISILKNNKVKSSKKQTLTYLADHGEEIYDTTDFYGHDWHRLTPNLFEIPYFIWLSNGFIKENGMLYGSIKRNVSIKASLESFKPTFDHLLSISNNEAGSQSFYSDKFIQKKRIVYDYDYDLF